DPEALLGNLMGDFVRGNCRDAFTDRIWLGIERHRQIDAYTDAHALVRASRRRVQGAIRRYAGILVDVFYDHFLARDWSTYGEIPLAEFAPGVYDLVDARATMLPERLQRLLPAMRAENWLVSYAELPGIDRALRRLSRRLRRENSLGEGVADLTADYDGFAADF